MIHWSLVDLALAQTGLPIINQINKAIVNPIILLLASASLIIFLYGVYEMVMNSDNQEKRGIGGQHILWGVIGLFIVVSVFGILWTICNTIGARCT